MLLAIAPHMRPLPEARELVPTSVAQRIEVIHLKMSQVENNVSVGKNMPQQSSSIPANANKECVGPAAEEAGKAPACAGCPNRTACASGKGREVDPGKDKEVHQKFMEQYCWLPARHTQEPFQVALSRCVLARNYSLIRSVSTLSHQERTIPQPWDVQHTDGQRDSYGC